MWLFVCYFVGMMLLETGSQVEEAINQIQDSVGAGSFQSLNWAVQSQALHADVMCGATPQIDHPQASIRHHAVTFDDDIKPQLCQHNILIQA
ncbi:hypothetical protein QBC36DRAFT_122077 [Triangularia setosa]|uniref:Uncharacterized protein n=1 Tax=Triangularia setosa TaxID=2587417 RepID=A0AAN6WFN7_9PEZI|nr:hypothetical protein QBC36DRAFT_122077 [Podospora setosa]